MSEKLFRISFQNQEQVLGQISAKQTDREVKKDFANKIKICESEASETLYWIEIIIELNWVDFYLVKNIFEESSQILAIFTSIGKKLKL